MENMDLDALLGFTWSAADESVAARMSLGVPEAFATPTGDAWLKRAEELADSSTRTPTLSLSRRDIEWLESGRNVPEHAAWLDANLPEWRGVLDYQERHDAYLTRVAEAEAQLRAEERERDRAKREAERQRVLEERAEEYKRQAKIRAEKKAQERAEEKAHRAFIRAEEKKEKAEQKRLTDLVKNIEEFYAKNNRLPAEHEEQYAQLRAILDDGKAFALVDNSRDTHPHRIAWRDSAKKFSTYVKKHGFPRVPILNSRKPERPITVSEAAYEEWQNAQYRRMRNGAMSFQSAMFLERTAPGWAVSRKRRRAIQTLVEYEEWTRREGTPKRRSENPEERYLAEFASKQRIRQNRGVATAVADPSADTSILEPTRTIKSWNEMFSQLEIYVEKNGRLPKRRSDTSLYADGEEEAAVWLKNQRGYNHVNLTDEQIAKLDAVSPEWQGRGKAHGETQAPWARSADEYASWVRNHGRLPLLTATDPEEKKLSVWYKTNRSKQNGSMGKTLDGENVGWNAAREADCVARFGENWDAHGRSTLFRESVLAHIMARG